MGAPQTQPPDVLVFLPGFATPSGAYRGLLGGLPRPGLRIIVPRLHPVRSALGLYTPAAEAEAASDIALEAAAPGGSIWLAGHSRGGQAAWRAAEILASRGESVAGLAVIDPVDGQGPLPWAPRVTDHSPDFDVKPVIVGFGRSGRCAPASVGFRAFAAACPAAEVVTLTQAGHADILDDHWQRAARRICRPGDDPAANRRTVAAVLLEWLQRPPPVLRGRVDGP